VFPEHRNPLILRPKFAGDASSEKSHSRPEARLSHQKFADTINDRGQTRTRGEEAAYLPSGDTLPYNMLH